MVNRRSKLHLTGIMERGHHLNTGEDFKFHTYGRYPILVQPEMV